MAQYNHQCRGIRPNGHQCKMRVGVELDGGYCHWHNPNRRPKVYFGSVEKKRQVPRPPGRKADAEPTYIVIDGYFVRLDSLDLNKPL